ncbi:glutaredoxin domain-containing cysteine-rich protein [Prunus yedoensis var. nudiflora]|uniref:Glutaredoxin domain-containing cysteine-rich protein n=1 Tax=Prunus yedoensis var. nudiflora TaxID=2094558 RepID=A0A314U869_PRUYE|nr:glutaredoxin domain-containing cysteine-rich protein [Prunus yedoensis var. nudiflora]
MGCASSKRVETAVVYKPAPASYAVFDINAIQEPWLVFDNTTLQEQQQRHEKPAHVPAQILDKLKSFETEAEAAPHTWDEVSKALEDLKPKTDPKSKPEPSPTPSPAQNEQTSSRKPRKSRSFHTLDEFDNPKPADLRKSESMQSLRKLNTESTRSESRVDSEATQSTQSAAGYIKPAGEREGREAGDLRQADEEQAGPTERVPGEVPARRGRLCGGLHDVVARGAADVRGLPEGEGMLEGHQVVYDERDVALHGEFLGELRGLLGEESNNCEGGVGVPRVFVKGRYLGGAEEVVELNESGVFGRMVVVGDKRERCPKCNENGLVQCVACWSLT